MGCEFISPKPILSCTSLTYLFIFFNESPHGVTRGSWISRGSYLPAIHMHKLHSSWDPMDCSPPGSSVHVISQVRSLKWVAISSSRGSFQLRDQTWVSCIAGGFFTTEPPGSPQRNIFSLKQGNLKQLEIKNRVRAGMNTAGSMSVHPMLLYLITQRKIYPRRTEILEKFLKKVLYRRTIQNTTL